MIICSTTVDVVGLSSKEVYNFMLTCTDEQYQRWWPGTHFVFHTLKRTPTNIGNLVCMDEYVGEYRVRFQAVVKRLVPNQEILWQMRKFGVLWPAWLRLQLTDTSAGLHIVHTLSAGFHGIGSVLDGLLRGYLSAKFEQHMAAHANTEFAKLRDLLRESEMAVSQTHEACLPPASAISEKNTWARSILAIKLSRRKRLRCGHRWTP